MPKLLRLLLSVFAVLSLGVALAACGDDDDADTDDTTTTEAADEPTDEGDATDEGDEAAGPACAEGDTVVFPADSEPADDADPVTITATEEGDGAERVYAFSENTATDLAEVGSYAVTLQNDGEEMHELIVSRINDDETRTTPELLAAAAGGENPEDFSEDIAAGSACPGESAVMGVDIESPGRYIALCFFPAGAVPGLTEEELGGIAASAPPHAAQGMVTEVTVS